MSHSTISDRNLSFHLSENDEILFYRKTAPGNELLIAVNLDPAHAQATMVHVPLDDLRSEPFVPSLRERRDPLLSKDGARKRAADRGESRSGARAGDDGPCPTRRSQIGTFRSISPRTTRSSSIERRRPETSC